MADNPVKDNAAKATEEILQKQNVELSEQQQEQMGKPLHDENGVNPADEAFLEMLVEKIETKVIDLYKPSSLLNLPVYEKLSEEAQGKADFEAVAMLSTIRQIYTLWKAHERQTYQIQNLVHQIRVTKERLEEAGGDIYII